MWEHVILGVIWLKNAKFLWEHVGNMLGTRWEHVEFFFCRASIGQNWEILHYIFKSAQSSISFNILFDYLFLE